jgi:hypothetical protein
MKKSERVYREILYRNLEKRGHFFKQMSLAKTCGTSIGNVHEALKPLERMNSIEKKPMGFTVINPKKILLYWASIRNLESDIIYQTHVKASVQEIEKQMPQVIYTAYSGYRYRFDSLPADYSEVFIYGAKELIEDRFPKQRGTPNLIVLKQDQHLETLGKAPIAQIFVDMWNIGTWYADEFVKDLDKRIESLIRK